MAARELPDTDSACPILVSFCNVKGELSPRLGVFDPATGMLVGLKITQFLPHSQSVTGLASDERFIYAATQRAQFGDQWACFLLTFSRKTFEFVSSYAFRRAQDVHSICWHDDASLLAVSTGTNEVVKLIVGNGVVESESVYWSSHPTDDDSGNDHLNGICSSPEGIVLCGFGRREDGFWSSAVNGFLLNISSGARLASGLEQPHSVMALDSSLVFCESRKRAVRNGDNQVSQNLPGYTRGMCKSGSSLFVGTSVGRKASRSTSQVLENPGDVGEHAGECTINRLDPQTLTLLYSSRLTLAVKEIYDLLAVEDVGLWPMHLETDR